jgi:hypothetical protein
MHASIGLITKAYDASVRSCVDGFRTRKRADTGVGGRLVAEVLRAQ